MRIFVLGRPGCGKSDLITAMFELTDHDNRSRCDNGVTIHTLNSYTMADTTEEAATNSDQIEIWEWSGKKIFQGIRSFFFCRGSLFLLCLSTEDAFAVADFMQTWQDIHCTISNPNIIIVFTHCDCQNEMTHNIKRTKSELVMYIQKTREVYSGSKKHGSTDLYGSLRNLEKALVVDTPCAVPLHYVGLRHRQGIHNLKMAVKKRVECETKQNLLLLTNHDSTIVRSRDIKTSKKILMKENEFLKKMGVCSRNEELIVALQSKNILLRLFTTNEEPYICTNPVKLAQMLVSVLVLNQTKVYQFDSQKFWGKDVTKRPDPGILVNVLEEVARQGVLRESLIPLLWQDITGEEGEVVNYIEFLGQLGIMSECAVTKTGNSAIVLDRFPRLQSDRTFYVNPVDLIPNKRPTLRWTHLPAADDVEVTVRFSFRCDLPSGFKHLIIGSCKNVNQRELLYNWTWSDGILIEFPKVTTRIDFTLDAIDVSGRTIALDHKSEQEAISAIWSALSYSLTAVENIKRNWKNLDFERSVRVTDNSGPLHGSLSTNRSDFIPVNQVFNNFSGLQKLPIPLQDLPPGCDYFGYVKHLFVQNERRKRENESLPQRTHERKTTLKPNLIRKCTTKRRQITWILRTAPRSNPQNKKMTSAESVSGSQKEFKNSKTKEEPTPLTTLKDHEDIVILDLVNEFVQEILRKGIAKYHEDMKHSGETKVKWSITSMTSFHATNENTVVPSDMEIGTKTARDRTTDKNGCVPSSKFCEIL
ncbi:uncharacterized protein LOC125653527 [Ostrea edulis]|uniref:uncharacterized protein LOC125653527 n=1 Tax=Ostrea edulis TaxID=37623 RepID=UPI00209538B6|nr:uncharacterized protein LOC125653527 [Ostrea edulis]